MFFRAIYLNKTTVLIGQSEGLPNITGSFIHSSVRSHNNNGAFTGFYGNTSANVGGDYYDYDVGSTFNASKGEIKTDGTLKTADEFLVYGNSNHVTPCNATIKVWQRIS